MKKEMRWTIQGYDTTVGHITDQMGGAPPPADTSAGAPPPGAKVREYDPATGSFK